MDITRNPTRPVRIGTIDLYGKRQGAAACAIAPGVVGSWDGLIIADGTAEVPIGVDACNPSPAIPYGTYKVWAWRGIEYEKWEGQVDVSPGRGVVPFDAYLREIKALEIDGAVSIELEYSPQPERIVEWVTEAYQATDHLMRAQDLRD